MCARRLAPGTTWVASPTAFPARTSLDPRPGDAHGRRRSRSVGVSVVLGRVTPFYLVEPDFPRFAGACADGFLGHVAMVAQLRRAPLTSPPVPAFGPGTAVVSSRRLAPLNMRSIGVSLISSTGAQVPTPSSARRRGLWRWRSEPPAPLFFLTPSAGTFQISW